MTADGAGTDGAKTVPRDALAGLHHVTAITADARANLAFYTRTLGMRLVKKTVNQDDPSAYHLFYADAKGSPGTDFTFFDWPNVPARRHGPGAIANVGLRVGSAESLGWWADRLGTAGVGHDAIEERCGRNTLRFQDPEGQVITLADDAGVPGGEPWTGTEVPAEHGIRGLGPVLLAEGALEPTATFLVSVLGFRQIGEYRDSGITAGHGSQDVPVSVFAMGAGGIGAEVHVATQPKLGRGVVGSGGVHHVAFRTANDGTHHAWQRYLRTRGVAVTPVIDRFYFRSLYFREPGGVLFEIATDGPGFAVDEPFDRLGAQLALPPFLEASRARIEAALKPLE